ncbi:multidrug ABC transporter ATP-binding protein [Zafaria cholistanensis]|uniref:Multidrug ABC transporter ATP-binding protein n=1 Tax=Zafaria cholistanensis TaxID=1682741 RepID=A0A5A7NQ95_9MICC|nr:ATP-binding cassette domain-containing protein [Zafaria cholistanensis]GER23033.1 multidrug ABC transporter ATP-binding protein [Zafaria cholistanensis]
MIQAHSLAKTYGPKRAVDGVTFTVQPGKVTGFLGPNGAGKSTTLRMAMGLDRPTSGTITVNGKALAGHRAPLREVGALLEAKSVHKSRTARAHLLALASTHGIGRARVDEVIGITGLGTVAGRKVGGFSLGMGQRLGIAAALLGDPQTLILDEPVNGLDPEGVLWVRNLARGLAAEGRTVFLSSHLMSEMAQTADHLIVIGRGSILADAPIAEILAARNRIRTLVRTEQPAELMNALAAPGVTLTRLDAETFEVLGADARTIARRALERQVLLHELTPLQASLEEAYLELTKDDVEYQSSVGAVPGAGKQA